MAKKIIIACLGGMNKTSEVNRLLTAIEEVEVKETTNIYELKNYSNLEIPEYVQTMWK